MRSRSTNSYFVTPALRSQEVWEGSTASEKTMRRIAAPNNAPLDGAGTRIPVPSPRPPVSFSTESWRVRRTAHLYTRVPPRAGDTD